MKYCIYCGMELLDEARFCPKCGKMVVMSRGAEETNAPEFAEASARQVPETVPQVPETVPPVSEAQGQKPVTEQADVPSEISVFVLGIVSIVLSVTGIPGLILSLITRSKIKAREQAVGLLTGKGKTGKTLATIALPVSIGFTVLWVVRIITSVFSAIRIISKLIEWSEPFQ